MNSQLLMFQLQFSSLELVIQWSDLRLFPLLWPDLFILTNINLFTPGFYQALSLKSAPIWFSELTLWLKEEAISCRIWFAGKEANSFSDWATLTALPIKLRYKMHTSEAHAMHRYEVHCLIHLYIYACCCVTTTPIVIERTWLLLQKVPLCCLGVHSPQRSHFDFFLLSMSLPVVVFKAEK